jgi:hypothetical protein
MKEKALDRQRGRSFYLTAPYHRTLPIVITYLMGYYVVIEVRKL